MAPLCSDPRQIVVNFIPARRRALLELVDDITNHMLEELQVAPDELGPVSTGESTPSSRGNSGATTPCDTPPLPGNEFQPPSRSSTQPIQDEKPKRTETDPRSPAQEGWGGGAKFDVGSKLKGLVPKPAQDALRIQNAAVKHLEDWKKEFMPKLREIVMVDDDDKIRAERKKRADAMARTEERQAAQGGGSSKQPYQVPDGDGDVQLDRSEDFFALQMLYAPVPTRLTTVPLRDRQEAVSCILLLLLSTGKYSAHSRTLALYLSASLELSQSFLIHEEMEIAQTLIESSKAGEDQRQASMSAEAEAAKRREANKVGRFLKVGLASVVGATVIGVTGGLAAPLVAGALGGVLGGIGLGGVASFLGIFWMNGALVGTLFGAFGAKMTGEMMDSYAKEVEDFKFIPLQDSLTGKDVGHGKGDQLNRRLRITIGINGWLGTEEDITKPWRVFSTETEVFALRYEVKTLLTVGTAFSDLIKSAAWNALRYQVIRHTVFATLMAALWPISVLTAASRVDNPFSRGLNRSRKAGHLLADALINRVQGERPVTLVGYSLGAATIHACLQSLAKRRAFGLVDTVVIIGAPAPSSPAHWRTLRTVVSGKVFNVYSENDMILGLVYRAYSMSMGVAGLQPIRGVDGVENLDLSACVSGHMRYPELTGEILRKCAFAGIDAGDEIPMDDVMVLKDDYAHGKIHDEDIDDKMYDQDAKELPHTDLIPGLADGESDPNNAPSDQETGPQLPPRPAAAAAAAAAATPPAAEVKPPLPRRPTAEVMGSAPSPRLPRRPTAAAAPTAPANPPLPRRPTAEMAATDGQVPDRPPPPYESLSTPAAVPSRRPVPPRRVDTSTRTISEPARPRTPDEDDDGGPIMMIDRDYSP
ncbi:Protein of unknown function (DUF726) [Geosmithia morbida]|uniref:Uncharacterized protein n=1 Tax=Geosmithia morbida TaxID=1094350 RepID=A0A9P4YZ35_9HYPO|nr:Protein of unknown function (DUF726) [Geosmithia morbida]KAF4125172.1 Protein of unknown function (DUF726) [Geosmithia morbida]